MAYLTKVSDFIELQEIANCAIVLTNSETFGNTINNIPSYAKKCFKKLHAIVVKNTVPCEILNTQTEEHITDFDMKNDIPDRN